MRVIIAGSRHLDIKDPKLDVGGLFEVIRKVLITAEDPEKLEIVSGGAKGSDQFGELIADFLGLNIVQFLPDWDKHGKAAGYRRNVQMADYAIEDPEGKAILIALWDGESKGTKHMIDIARKEGLDLHILMLGNFMPKKMVSESETTIEPVKDSEV